MTVDAAIKLAVNRFPSLLTHVDEPADMELAGAYTPYELLAREIIENHSDESFLRDACAFIDELAESGDDLLEEVLVVSLLEGLAVNPTVARKVRLQLKTKALEMLRCIEVELFGRTKTQS